MTFLYYIIIKLYQFSINIASLFGNPKAMLWIAGRKGLFARLESTLKPNERRIWVHAASLGEFEQGRPLIEKIKELHPEYKIVLTFFSPSGYEVRKNYTGADYIFYLPADTPGNAMDPWVSAAMVALGGPGSLVRSSSSSPSSPASSSASSSSAPSALASVVSAVWSRRAMRCSCRLPAR